MTLNFLFIIKITRFHLVDIGGFDDHDFKFSFYNQNHRIVGYIDLMFPIKLVMVCNFRLLFGGGYWVIYVHSLYVLEM